MRLYSRKQALIYCAISGIIVGAISAACTVFFLGNGTQSSPKQQTELKEASVVPSESSSMGKTDAFDLEAETPSVNVANDSPNYTQDELQNISVYEKCNEAVANITTQTMGYNWFLEPVITGSGSGSGSIIDKRGYVVTNCHVIEDATTINISLADGTRYEGHVTGKDI